MPTGRYCRPRSGVEMSTSGWNAVPPAARFLALCIQHLKARRVEHLRSQAEALIGEDGEGKEGRAQRQVDDEPLTGGNQKRGDQRERHHDGHVVAQKGQGGEEDRRRHDLAEREAQSQLQRVEEDQAENQQHRGVAQVLSGPKNQRWEKRDEQRRGSGPTASDQLASDAIGHEAGPRPEKAVHELRGERCRPEDPEQERVPIEIPDLDPTRDLFRPRPFPLEAPKCSPPDVLERDLVGREEAWSQLVVHEEREPDPDEDPGEQHRPQERSIQWEGQVPQNECARGQPDRHHRGQSDLVTDVAGNDRKAAERRQHDTDEETDPGQSRVPSRQWQDR